MCPPTLTMLSSLVGLLGCQGFLGMLVRTMGRHLQTAWSTHKGEYSSCTKVSKWFVMFFPGTRCQRNITLLQTTELHCQKTTWQILRKFVVRSKSLHWCQYHDIGEQLTSWKPDFVHQVCLWFGTKVYRKRQNWNWLHVDDLPLE